MVGLYHKRRAERSQSKVLRCMIRVGAGVGVFTVVGFSLVALLLNGSAIKGPLGSYLSAKTGLDVTIEDAEFSPVYPDVIKLNNVSFGSSKVGELYLEYDLKSAIGDDELRINDIYINGLKLHPDDLATLSSSKAGYNSIRANAVRFHHTPINTRFLKTKDATIRLNQVTFSDKGGLTFRSGTLAAEKLGLFDEMAKNFVVDFEQASEGMRLNNFSVRMYGGIIAGKGIYSQHALPASAATTSATAATAAAAGATASTSTASGAASSAAKGSTAPVVHTDIKLDELNLSNVILYSGLTSPKNITLTSAATTLSDTILTDEPPASKASNQGAKGASATVATVSTKMDAKAAEDAAQAAEKAKADGKAKTNPQDDVRLGAYIVQGINGSVEGLCINDQGMRGFFSGTADEISLPNLQTTMEHNEVTADFSKDGVISFKLQGNVYEGRYLTQGELDHNKKELNVEKLLLKKAKLALNTPRVKFISSNISDYTFNLKHAGFEGLEFLSYLNTLPMSIQSITGTADNLSVKAPAESKEQDNFYRVLNSFSVLKDGVFAATESNKATAATDKSQGDQTDANKDATTPDSDKHLAAAAAADEAAKAMDEKTNAAMELEFKNFLYSDLLISRLHSKYALDGKLLSIEVPEARFKESTATAEAQLALNAFETSFVKVGAPDFESADLNSNLINHMLTGKVDFSFAAESQAQAKTLDSLINETKGVMRLSSDAMLVSDLGLDLINGGKNQSYDLSYTELLTAVQGSVAGISNLKSRTTFIQGQAKSTSSMSLSTASMNTSFVADYERNTLSGTASFMSPGKDSSTRVTMSGSLDDPRFKITPLRRGAQRPGLYLPQYDAGAKAKEQTDAASVLNGKVKIEAPSKDSSSSSDDLKESSDPDESASKPQTSTDPASSTAAANATSADADTAKEDAAAATDTTDSPATTPSSGSDSPADTAVVSGAAASAASSSEAGTSTDSSTTDKADKAEAQAKSEASQPTDTSASSDSKTSNEASTTSEAGDQTETIAAQSTTEENKPTAPATEDKVEHEVENQEAATTEEPKPADSSTTSKPKDEAAVTEPTESSKDEPEAASKDADSPAATTATSETTAPAPEAKDEGKVEGSEPTTEEPKTDSPATADEAKAEDTKSEEAAPAPTTETAQAAENTSAAAAANEAKAEATNTAQPPKAEEPVATQSTTDGEAAKDAAETSKDASEKDEATQQENVAQAQTDTTISKEEQAAADKTEMDLLKDVLIDSLFDTQGPTDEEELIF